MPRPPPFRLPGSVPPPDDFAPSGPGLRQHQVSPAALLTPPGLRYSPVFAKYQAVFINAILKEHPARTGSASANLICFC